MTRTALLLSLTLPLAACSEPALFSLQPDLDSDVAALEVQVIDWEFGSPVVGATVCPLLEAGSACAVTDGEGRAELFVQPAALGGTDESDLVLLQVEAVGHMPGVHSRPGTDADRPWRLMAVSERTFEDQMAGANTDIDPDSAHVFVRGDGASVEDRWLEVGEGAGRVLYAGEDGQLRRAAEMTSASGVAVLANAAAGVVEVGLLGKDMKTCQRESGWDMGPGMVRTYALPAHISFVHQTCR